MPTRIWEILLGAILANFEFYYGVNKKKLLSFIFPLIGFLLIIFSFIFYNDRMFLPSFASLPVLIGTVLIIYFRNKNEIITKILSTKLLVGLGLISYSLYLWHYPIIVIFKNFNIFYLLMIVFFLSILTYFFIEKPFRKSRYNFFYNFKILLIFFIIIFSINLVFILNSGFYKSDKYPKIISELIDKKIKNSNLTQNVQKYDDNKKDIYIVGDSHMSVLSDALISETKISKYNLVKLIGSGCYYIYDFDKIQKFSNKIQDYCNRKTQENRRKTILSSKDSIVIIGGRLDVYVSGRRYNNGEGHEEQFEWWIFKSPENFSIQKGIRDSIEELLFNGNKVILIYPVPGVGFDINKKIFDRFIYDKSSFEADLLKNPITTSYKNYIEYAKASYEILNSINHSNLYKVYPHQLFCNIKIQGRCMVHDSEHTFYLDNNHLSYFGNKILTKAVIKKIKEIEDKFN